jgi:hypothetical protein
MAEDGQMILLSALIACLCLVGVVACMSAVSFTPDGETGYLSADTVDNILWAQDTAISDAVSHTTGGPWDERYRSALNFEKYVDRSIDGLSCCLLKHGVAYRFGFNATLAARIISLYPDKDMENVGGTIVERRNGSTTIYGCAYDVAIEDAWTGYKISSVKTF